MQQTNVLEYLEHTVKRLPDKVAYSNESEGLTFAEVYHDSRAIGSYLNSKGYYGEPVVVFMKKHPKAIAAFYGCVYGGNYYVPIDEEMPRFRIDLIFDNLKPKVMICDESTQEMAKTFDFDGELLIYDEVSQSPINEDALAQIRDKQLDTDPIYIVFTSGSTGVPKGVVACHRSVIDYIENLSEVLEFNEDTRFANQTPLYFDACLKELYPTLKFGASTVIVPKSLFMFPVKLVEFLNEHKIHTVCWVVSALTMISSFKTFDKVVPEYLHTVAFGSEVFPIKQFKIWKETLPNATSLTLGYYHNFEKTNEVFVQNPLNDRYPELIYRTGDLGKFNEFGELVFVSRKDYQIKHMGHRIELGEIEVNVNMMEGISTSCCVYDKEKEKIVLYYVGDLEVKDVVSILKDKLPRYMIPNKVERLDQMPLTANGKIDRVFLKNKYQETKKEKN